MPTDPSTSVVDQPVYRRAVVHCLVPQDLAARLYPTLRDWFAEDPQISVAVERRAGSDRRRGGSGAPLGRERRSGEDRRADQNVSTAAAEGLELPWSAQRHADELRLILSPVPVHPAGWDREAHDLVIAARAGETGALDVLWLHHYDRVRRAVEHSVGERRASAATDEVFRVAFERLLDPRSDEVPTAFNQWLGSVAAEVTRGQWHVR